jgi:hypothetical protein
MDYVYLIPLAVGALFFARAVRSLRSGVVRATTRSGRLLTYSRKGEPVQWVVVTSVLGFVALLMLGIAVPLLVEQTWLHRAAGSSLVVAVVASWVLSQRRPEIQPAPADDAGGYRRPAPSADDDVAKRPDPRITSGVVLAALGLSGGALSFAFADGVSTQVVAALSALFGLAGVVIALRRRAATGRP